MRHDLSWFKDTLKKCIWDHFDLMPNKELEVKTTTNDAGEQPAAEAGQEEELKLPETEAS